MFLFYYWQYFKLTSLKHFPIFSNQCNAFWIFSKCRTSPKILRHRFFPVKSPPTHTHTHTQRYLPQQIFSNRCDQSCFNFIYKSHVYFFKIFCSCLSQNTRTLIIQTLFFPTTVVKFIVLRGKYQFSTYFVHVQTLQIILASQFVPIQFLCLSVVIFFNFHFLFFYYMKLRHPLSEFPLLPSTVLCWATHVY